MKHLIVVATLSLCAPLATAADASVARVESGTRIVENVPDIPADLAERLQRYQNTRGAQFVGWNADGASVLISTRFGNTAQVHRVKMPGGAREQLTFYEEPVRAIAASPARDMFVFGKDVGGSEFWQLYAFDGATREITMLTDGKSRNGDPLFSHDGRQLAYSSTLRNGKDTDVWVRDLDGGKSRVVVTAGGSWQPVDFSGDGKRLIVMQYVSANESRPTVVDLASGALTKLYDEKKRVAYGNLRFSSDGASVYYTSDESGEFSELRKRDLASTRSTSLTANIPWDVEGFVMSHDGRRIAFVTNEDAIGVLHVRDLDSGKDLALPKLPTGVIDAVEFRPDGAQVALSINSATSPSDVYSIDLAAGTLARWTESEVGGLDTASFIAPELVRFPTFDKAGGKPRTIPALYYRPKGDGPFPSVVVIHGGPEAQSRPVFSADAQFLAGKLGVAVLVPNVRGSSGYGKTYLELDNGFKREDSVKDIGALLDWIGTRKELDAGRVGVYGGSYGGYMVLAAMTHYNARLRAGVDIVGISNFVTFLNNTESYRRDLRRAEYGDERDPKMHAHLQKISPMTNAKNITIPLFVAQGANDPRVPASEAEQIVRTVRGNGGNVWYLLQKDEGHGFQKKSNKDYFGAATMQFWKQYLIGDERR
ncbi:S9 family peptidase [Tahibacter soli]|uniref:Alpha/beta fold hydrolase n=1 Tax=Tahibacter soli TaxID=2983605 RepID=A0A9X3YLY9_9GAMM|nr:alpha/beta fold hydrolase [Tahibacter soli]MDC8013163.1 alpha/beta fold hydrolase [Tahibacter soli]